jgi:hypothetical protein
MERLCCCLCSAPLVKTLTLEKFPVTFSPPSSDNDIFKDLAYGYCPDCGSVQLMTLIPQDLLYSEPHNGTAHSTTWKQHHTSFLDFISVPDNSRIIEVGGYTPQLEKTNEYYVLNINSHESNSVNFIQGNCEEFNFKGFDVVIMSHVFEHLYEPVKFIKRCSEGGVSHVIISHPVMNENSKILPIHTEHTFFADFLDVKAVFENNNFRLEKTENFKNHSIFFHFVRGEKCIGTSQNKRPGREVSIFNNFKKRMEIISSIDVPDNTYIIPGGHFGQVVYYYLKNKNIIGFLDNDINKHGKRVYGTHLTVHPIPPELSNVTLIVYAGLYSSEIIDSLSCTNCTILKIDV